LGVCQQVLCNLRGLESFHPKIYLFEASGKRADLFIGSSNMTGGVLYTNYESNIHLIFDLSGKDMLCRPIRSISDILI
jgi:HKD family nuclease